MEGLPMSEMTIHCSTGEYRVLFIDDFVASLAQELIDGDTVIIDKKVLFLYQEHLKSVLIGRSIVEIEATEIQKSYEGVIPVIEKLIESGFKKNHRLCAIGGGITQDITAFIASILYRGVSWIFYPTTLLAQADSCIGSKTSINFRKYKNQIGNFYPPKGIFICLRFLYSLDKKELVSGLGEMAHYYLVSGEEDFHRFWNEYLLAQSDKKILESLIHRSLEIKKKYIEIDEFDKKERQIFNYGHSFGHAIESLSDYAIPHGIAVSIGMDIANFVSVKYGYLTIEKRNEMRKMLEPIWQGYSMLTINLDDFENALRKDKKNKGNLLGLILSKGPGKTFKEFKLLDAEFSSWLKEYFTNEFI
jgi:3-dehydroquinate synthase